MLTPKELAAMRVQVKTVERGDGETEYFMYFSRSKMLELLDEVERLQKIKAATRAVWQQYFDAVPPLSPKKKLLKDLFAALAETEGGNTNANT